MWTNSRGLKMILGVVALTACLIRAGIAGNYHTGDTLKCSDCHISHASLSHNESGQTSNWGQPANGHLIKGDMINTTCLQCHDNQPGLPDVVGADVNNSSEIYDGSERAGGNFPDSTSDNWKGHDLHGQSDNQMDCTSCHDPHGNSNYRNLKALDGSKKGPEAFVNPIATGLDRYRRSNIGYVKSIGDKLCVQCHEIGASGGSGGSHRHPSTSATMTITIDSVGRSTDPEHWTMGKGCGFEVNGDPVPRVPFAVSSANDYDEATRVNADNEVLCLSCHKAHGSVHPFGMQWPYGGREGLISSSGCNQCHNISGA